jgi:hypothetical protein
MAPRRSIRGLIRQFLEERRPDRIGRVEWDAIVLQITREIGDARKVHPRYVLDVLHETDLEVDRSLGGLPLDLRGRVHSRDAEAAAESLLAMSTEYAQARAAGDALRAEDVRRAVRQAKDRLRLIVRRRNLREETRAEKQELLEWFLVWLENPSIFPPWLEVRRGRRDAGR